MKRIIIPSILRYMAHFIQHISSVTKYLQSISQFQINRNNYNYLVINSNQIFFSLASFQYNETNIYILHNLFARKKNIYFNLLDRITTILPTDSLVISLKKKNIVTLHQQ